MLLTNVFHHDQSFCPGRLILFFGVFGVQFAARVCVFVCGQTGAIKVRPSTTGRHKPRPSSKFTGSSSSSSSSSSSPWSSMSRDDQINGLSQYSLSLFLSFPFFFFFFSFYLLPSSTSSLIRLLFWASPHLSALTNAPHA